MTGVYNRPDPEQLRLQAQDRERVSITRALDRINRLEHQLSELRERVETLERGQASLFTDRDGGK